MYSWCWMHVWVCSSWVKKESRWWHRELILFIFIEYNMWMYVTLLTPKQWEWSESLAFYNVLTTINWLISQSWSLLIWWYIEPRLHLCNTHWNSVDHPCCSIVIRKLVSWCRQFIREWIISSTFLCIAQRAKERKLSGNNQNPLTAYCIHFFPNAVYELEKYVKYECLADHALAVLDIIDFWEIVMACHRKLYVWNVIFRVLLKLFAKHCGDYKISYVFCAMAGCYFSEEHGCRCWSSLYSWRHPIFFHGIILLFHSNHSRHTPFCSGFFGHDAFVMFSYVPLQMHTMQCIGNYTINVNIRA